MNKPILFAMILAFSFGSTAHATVITFSEPGASNSSFLSTDGLVLAEYVWQIGALGHDHVNSVGGNPGAFEQGHGQQWQGLRFSNVGGGAITLNSFDMQGDWLVSSLNDFTGTAFSTPLGGGWVTQSSGFSATPYVYIYSIGGGPGNVAGPAAWLDNVVLNNVPEPGTLALFSLGWLGLGLARRRTA